MPISKLEPYAIDCTMYAHTHTHTHLQWGKSNQGRSAGSERLGVIFAAHRALIRVSLFGSVKFDLAKENKLR